MTIDELADHGVERMDEETIREFLETQGIGVLGLPTERLPYMVPLY
jgi:nitroimidazol reductase NimA-like FMN-containing flavoprotein (pyridoxamine 5'-phosphate oxidase superfamily)